ncbi:MAG: sulfite exporter TauE/SafE family protein [Deltaproteobacteria bacterium]|jgi:uncharacterized membrane protein YfcA|nr:sulfite exporter TauE/SafE family protein [Deltaproteobacteria bacterium]
MSILSLTILIPLTLIIGIGAAAIGATAWTMLVPVLFVLLGFNIYVTLFLSLLIDCVNALVMTVISARQQQLDVGQGLKLSVFGSVFVIMGIYLGTTFIPQNEEMFKSPTVVIILCIGLSFIRKGYRQGRLELEEDDPKPHFRKSIEVNSKNSPFRRVLFFPAVFLVSFWSGLTGIGGGMLYSVFLMFFRGYQVLKATGTSMLLTFITTVFATSGIYLQIPAEHAINQQMALSALILVAVSVSGTVLGARVVYSLSLKKLNYLIGVVILTAALVAIIQRMFFIS